MKPRRPRMTRQLIDRLIFYMRDYATLSQEVEWQPGEGAQWDKDFGWLVRMSEWFDARGGES